jgi:hypothetical protein
MMRTTSRGIQRRRKAGRMPVRSFVSFRSSTDSSASFPLPFPRITDVLTMSRCDNRQFVDTLERFHAEIETHAAKKTGLFGGRRLHFHLFERLQRPHAPPTDKPASETQKEMSMKEALCLLEQKPYTPTKPNAWQRLADFENFLRSPDSIYALKTALAAIVYTTLLWAPKTRGWFINYGLTVWLPVDFWWSNAG